MISVSCCRSPRKPRVTLQLSYSRYWEGLTKMQGVTSNWTSAAAHALAFVKDTPAGRRSFGTSAIESAKRGGALEPNLLLTQTEDEIAKNATFYYDMLHLVSLCHAVVSAEVASRVLLRHGCCCAARRR